MITGAQVRAARALLGWSAAQLAERSGLSYSTIQRVESVAGVGTTRANNLLLLQQTLEEAGIIFLFAGEMRRGGDGVRLRGGDC